MQPRVWLSMLLAAPLVSVAAGASPLDLLKPPSEPRRVTVRLAAEIDQVAPGKPFAVYAEVTPQPGIRVYGPGNPEYAPPTLTLQWPEGTRADEPTYPPPEPYLFGELAELVQVYSRTFRITLQVTLPRTVRPKDGEALTVTGSLRYQACTDRVCFPVESLPVELPLRLRSAAPASGAR